MPRDAMSVSKCLEYVKEKGVPLIRDQIAFHQRIADDKANSNHPKDKDKARMHSKRAAAFGELAEVLEELSVTNPLAFSKPTFEIKDNEPPTFLRIGDVNELPEALRKQIKISESDKLDMDIIESINGFGGIAAIDEVLVAIWKSTGNVLDREYLARKIYRLTRNGSLKSAKRKGYFTTDLSNDDDGSDNELPLED